MRVRILFELLTLLLAALTTGSNARKDPWNDVRCRQIYVPEYCNYTDLSVKLDEMDRCAPALLEISIRNYFLGAAGRRTTYKDNKDAFDRLRLRPHLLRGVSCPDPQTFILGEDVDFPIGLSPVGRHKLIQTEGEKDTVRGLSGMRTVMILSSLGTTGPEEVAAEARATGGNLRLWMQVYVFLNRSITVELVRRAERSGFEAIVLTADAPIPANMPCHKQTPLKIPPPGVRLEDFRLSLEDADLSVDFDDIRWLRSLTNLPVIAKGILTEEDALKAAAAGASAIIVSNHGGRHLDGDLASIDALPRVVNGLSGLYPSLEVYLDSGVRSGHDVFKALARGAKMVFLGRPQIWGLAYGGPKGVRAMISNLVEDFEEIMQLSSVSKVSDINIDFLVSPESCDATRS